MEMTRLAARDMVREPLHAFCIMALIAGVLAPLMLLMTGRDVVMGTLIGALRDNPNTRRIDIVGNHGFGDDDLAALRAWPELAFVVPEERSIARRIEVRPEGARRFVRVTLVSSAGGDPLLPDGLVLGPGEAAISASLAARHGLAPGDVMPVHALRGMPPTARAETVLMVRHVLPRGWLQGPSALVPHRFSSRIEAFYDGFAVAEFGVEDGADAAGRPVRYASFRLFARDIREVGTVEERLERALGVTVRSRAGEIRPLIRLDRDIRLALDVLTACATGGLAAALVALFWSGIERKRRVLSMLALMGVPPRACAVFPVAQAMLYAIGGGVLALLLFAAGIAAFRTLFADAIAPDGGEIASIDPLRIASLLAGLVLVAVLASSAAAYRASQVEPADVIREGG